MAGNHDCDWVAVIGQTHSAEAFGLPYCSGDSSVGAGFTIRDFKQGTPAFHLEIRPSQVEPKCEIPALAREVLVQFANVRPGSNLGLDPFRFRFPGRKHSAIELEENESLI
jgi:hypothetical protein